MKLLILSDLHAEFNTFQVPENLEYDVVVLAGDILEPGSAAAALLRGSMGFGDQPIVQVAGNHEYYETVLGSEQTRMRDKAKEHDIHFVDCDETVIGGVRFLGCTLWTDFCLHIVDPGFPGGAPTLLSDRFRAMAESQRYVVDYTAIRVAAQPGTSMFASRRIQPIDTLLIHRRHRSWLRRKLAEHFSGPTVVVTHHAPHRNSLAPKYAEEWTSAAYVTELRDEFFDVPALWVHGHTHTSFDYQVGNCRVLCNPRGYVDWNGDFENRDFNPAFVVEIPHAGSVAPPARRG
jgi:predicted phosphodiesterase